MQAEKGKRSGRKLKKKIVFRPRHWHEARAHAVVEKKLHSKGKFRSSVEFIIIEQFNLQKGKKSSVSENGKFSAEQLSLEYRNMNH
jgi:hypothetical protein